MIGIIHAPLVKDAATLQALLEQLRREREQDDIDTDNAAGEARQDSLLEQAERIKTENQSSEKERDLVP